MLIRLFYNGLVTTSDGLLMRYRSFGSTGIEVSELVFGGGAVGGILINADDDTRRTAIARALDAGINWIDTAPSYGDGRSETALGWLLAEIDTDVHVSTKFTIDTSFDGGGADIRGQIERSVAASLKRLQREQVTCLQLHNPIGARSDGRTIGVDAILGDNGVLDSLDAIGRGDIYLHVGITALGEPDAIRQVIESGRIDSAQVYFNLLNPTAAFQVPRAWGAYDFAELLATCQAQGVAAMNIRVLSAGVIATDTRTGRERPLTPGDTVQSETAKAAAMFAKIGDKFGTRAQTALRFALAEPRLSCVVVGLAELDHLAEAIEAAEQSPLSEAELAEVRGVYATFIAGPARP